ncbi:uncharacterized protein BKCO1_38000104 [Diplodia corticola]|uniref:Uncharacterized protein n=1 Tax=Diplodia corticola TaxID=236234 RepID=A0A1J9QVD4_9PEZI|nr:uncharacterized protein BKCO1_38000104 [Diplodia corticola]OJD32361.1 hypothetical protein BKCO1_38000104 [Diplodia corticola]
MACPIHSPSAPTASDAPEDPSEPCAKCCQQKAEESHQFLDSDVHRPVATEDSSQQGPAAVRWSALSNEYEVTGHDAEGHPTGAFSALDDSTSVNSQPLDTPSSSSDGQIGTSCPLACDSASQDSGKLAISDDGSDTGASSGYGCTVSDAVRDRFLACDGPWSTYNRRVELLAYGYDHYQSSSLIYDIDDDCGNVAPYVG